MIKCKDQIVEGYVNGSPKVRVSLTADTSSEVIAAGTDASKIDMLSDDSILTLGSTCLTADGDFGSLDSNGVWHF